MIAQVTAALFGKSVLLRLFDPVTARNAVECRIFFPSHIIMRSRNESILLWKEGHRIVMGKIYGKNILVHLVQYHLSRFFIFCFYLKEPGL